MECFSCDPLSTNENSRATILRLAALRDVHIKGEGLSEKIKLLGKSIKGIVRTFLTSEGIQQDTVVNPSFIVLTSTYSGLFSSFTRRLTSKSLNFIERRERTRSGTGRSRIPVPLSFICTRVEPIVCQRERWGPTPG